MWCVNPTLSSPACYRIMEAALEQACSAAESHSTASPQQSVASLSVQQTRQVLGVLAEAFSAQIYYLQQVRGAEGGGGIVFTSDFSLSCQYKCIMPSLDCLWLLPMSTFPHPASSPSCTHRWTPVAMATPLSSPHSDPCARGWLRRRPA